MQSIKAFTGAEDRNGFNNLVMNPIRNLSLMLFVISVSAPASIVDRITHDNLNSVDQKISCKREETNETLYYPAKLVVSEILTVELHSGKEIKLIRDYTFRETTSSLFIDAIEALNCKDAEARFTLKFSYALLQQLERIASNDLRYEIVKLEREKQKLLCFHEQLSLLYHPNTTTIRHYWTTKQYISCP